MFSTTDKKHICVINKNDLDQQIDTKEISNPIYISTKNRLSVENLCDEITKQIFNQEININTNIYISNARQIAKLVSAKDALEKAIQDIYNEQFIDFIELSIKTAWISLGEILGEVKDTELLDELFSKFCLGK